MTPARPTSAAAVEAALPAEAIAVLAAWLDRQRQLVETGQSADPATRAAEIHRAMAALCAEAHRHAMRAEQLIVLLRRLWHALPPAAATAQTHVRAVFDEIVSVCIQEFYAPIRGAAAVDGSGTPGSAGR